MCGNPFSPKRFVGINEEKINEEKGVSFSMCAANARNARTAGGGAGTSRHSGEGTEGEAAKHSDNLRVWPFV